jgi:O-antigen ligase
MFGLLPLLLVALALTLSRGGYISLMVAIAFVWYRVARERRFLPVIAMIAILGLLLPFLPEAFWQRAESILPSVTEQRETFGKRLDLWELGLDMVRDRPILGVGVGNFTSVYEKYARGGMLATRLTAHNAYIAVAAEVGLIGLVLFLVLHGYALHSARSAIRVGHELGRDDIRIPGTIFEVGILAMMIMGLSGATEAEKLLWIIFGMVSVLGEHVARLGASAKPRSA